MSLFFSSFIHLCLCLGLVLSSAEASSGKPVPSSFKKLKVVATFSVLGDMIRHVGGEFVEVSVIVPENADPHVHQPTPKDAKMIAQADLVIRNGLGFEGWFDRLIDNSGYKGPYVTAAETVKARPLLTSLPSSFSSSDIMQEKPLDPHAWHCVKNGIQYVQIISNALKKALPLQQEIIDQNTKKYIEELEALDGWVRQEFKKIPSQDRYVITTHDAFWYYGDSYGVHFLSPVGISTDAEPAASAIAQLLKDIKQKKIKAIFIENLSSRKLIEEISREAGLTIDGVLYADSLSDPAATPSPAKTYVEMIRHNTRSILKALFA